MVKMVKMDQIQFWPGFSPDPAAGKLTALIHIP